MESIKDVLPSVLSSLQNPEKLKRTQLISEWNKIIGEKLVENTRPSLTKDGTLFVWVNQSTLAFEINQKLRPSLLKRAQALLGEGEVKKIRVRVGQLRY